MRRRDFLAASLLGGALSTHRVSWGQSSARGPARIPNEYSLFLPGEREALARVPKIQSVTGRSVRLLGATKTLRSGEEAEGWRLLAVFSMNGIDTAVFEKQVTHQGAIVYLTEAGGEILRISKGVGRLSSIRPRPIDAPVVQFRRESPYRPGPDRIAEHILSSNQDPCYENIAALGPEYIGWTLVANEQSGPQGSLFLQADGASRELPEHPQAEESWAPDLDGSSFDPLQHLPDKYPEFFKYVHGFSKRTLLGGYLPVANTGVWSADTRSGYEVLVLLPSGEQAKPMATVRGSLPASVAEDETGEQAGNDSYLTRYWGTTPDQFWSELAGIANYWQHLYEDRMRVHIPDPWLLDAARAGLTLARCSYRGLHPTYQVGEGAYTKIPERSHALFPVAHYEFVWAHQLWNLTAEVEPYGQFYLENYILPDGNFLYNTQDQVEAPLNVGIFLWNSARGYDYGRDILALQRRLPVLRRMINYVLSRYEYSLNEYPPDDRRYGLIWGSPEADLGDPHNDYPNSHPFYFQNAVWTWRGLNEHARCLAAAGNQHGVKELQNEAEQMSKVAVEMRGLIEKSLSRTMAASSPRMRAAGITPFTPDDTLRDPTHLRSYENHRFMMDWFTADWGDQALDVGHLKHRELAGQQICGLHTDGDWARTSNFMAHGTLAVRIRQDDYRPFLLTLYALCCYAADSGNRYSPEDAYLPGSCPGEGSKYGWSAVVNSVLQPTMGLRWLLCYEESDREICHIQKAAPKHWFATGERIEVDKCPTRFGVISWTTIANSDSEWRISLSAPDGFRGQVRLHIHPSNDARLHTATVGRLERQCVVFEPADWQSGRLESVVRSGA